MTIDEAVEFFQPIPKIFAKVKTLQDVGLGYITLGQQSTTLSEEKRSVLNWQQNWQKDKPETPYIFLTNQQQDCILKM
jgi:excinuclease UvrABC ATPase subunit